MLICVRILVGRMWHISDSFGHSNCVWTLGSMHNLEVIF